MRWRAMRVAATVAAAAGALAVSVLSVSAAPPPGTMSAVGAAVAKCPPWSRATVAADADAQVYVAGSGTANYWGCVFGHRPVRLPGAYGGVRTVAISRVTVAGDFAAYAVRATNGPAAEVFNVDRINLETRAVEVSLPCSRGSTLSVGGGPAIDLDVTPSGAFAWICSSDLTASGYVYYEVHERDRETSRLLAGSSDIDPGSLAVSSSHVYWFQGGVPEAAPLG